MKRLMGVATRAGGGVLQPSVARACLGGSIAKGATLVLGSLIDTFPARDANDIFCLDEG